MSISLQLYVPDPEKAVLGAILLDSGSSERYCFNLSPDVFAVDVNRKLFKVMLKLMSEKKHIDLTILAEALPKVDPSYIYSLLEVVASAAGIKAHIDILTSRYIFKQITYQCGLTQKRYRKKNLTF